MNLTILYYSLSQYILEPIRDANKCDLSKL